MSYALILIGGILALYQQSLKEPNQYLLVLGLGMLMVGIYTVSRRIPNKNKPEDTDSDESI